MNVIKQSRARSTGTMIMLIDNRDRSFDADDPNGWFNLCDDHGGIVSHETRNLAAYFMPAPEIWCAGCQELSVCACCGVKAQRPGEVTCDDCAGWEERALDHMKTGHASGNEGMR